MHSNFVHLHVHSQYSLLDGACTIPALIKKALEYKMPAIAVTDHGNMFGAIEFYRQAMAAGVKPIIGCEVYVAPDSRFEKTSHGVSEASFHLTLLVKNETGYKNLMKLVSIGYLEGFYYKPRIDRNCLKEHAKGLIALSGCLKGELPHLILSGQDEKALKLIEEYRNIFDYGDYYLEVQDHNIEDQKRLNRKLIEISKIAKIGVCATNDVHYISRDKARAHETLLCIQTQTTLDDPKRMRLSTDEFYLKSPQEMSELFKDCPDAIRNTIQITEKCNLELEFNKLYLPHFKAPDGLTKEEYLRGLCAQGLKSRYPDPDKSVLDRLEKEIKIIKNSGYISYFLITWDFVNFAKSKSIPVGPGRGSAAGSIVSYLLGITDIDPLKYDLLFERFLNPDRVSMPDIDIDFCYERRDEVIDYVTKKYGQENVAQIITFGTMLARAVTRDVGRAMNMPYADVDKIAKMIPADLGMTLDNALKSSAELKSAYESNMGVRQLIDMAKDLEGLSRHASTHAAGVVISEKPLTEFVPLCKAGDEITTGYPMESLEKIGLLKIDFLGLRNLTVIDETLKIVKRTRGMDADLANVPLDDAKTFRLLRDAKTIGVFQLESSGMRDLLKKLQLERFEDIIALLALYRPGPIGSGMLDDFIKRKHDNSHIKYDHPKLETILKETYGIIVYQEQVMRIASDLAGFSLAQADLLRRAMSKKTPEVMDEQRKHFVDGCAKNSINKAIASKIFDLIEYFAGYGFNKSHSTAYSMISYRTAYLKSNFSVEYMTALLSSEPDNMDKIVMYIGESNAMGIKVLPPDINESFSSFTVVGNEIRFGLSAVKNVGLGAIESIITSRAKGGKFSSIFEFCQRVDSRTVNRKVIESLIKCGAFDSFKLFRSQAMAILDRALEMGSKIQKDRSRGQLSFFDTEHSKDDFNNFNNIIPKISEWPETQILSFEKDTLGIYVTSHPLVNVSSELRNYISANIAELANGRDSQDVSVGGIIAKIKNTSTKKSNERMAIVGLEDLTGTIEVLVFPRTYSEYAINIQKEQIVIVKGKLNLREDQPKIIANEVVLFDEVKKKSKPRCVTALSSGSVVIEVLTSSAKENILDSLKFLLYTHRGATPVYLNFKDSNGACRKILLSREYNVTPSIKLIDAVKELVGQDCVRLDQPAANILTS